MHQPSVLRFSRARVHDNRAWGSSNRSRDVHISLTGTKVKRARNHDPTEQCDLLSERSAEEHIPTFLPFPPAPGYRPRPFSEIGNSNLYARVQPFFPSLQNTDLTHQPVLYPRTLALLPNPTLILLGITQITNESLDFARSRVSSSEPSPRVNSNTRSNPGRCSRLSATRVSDRKSVV